jgi:hypothetical protein
MTTKAPAKVREESQDSPVRKIYNIVDELKDIIPVMNDRYRLGFCLNRYFEDFAGSIREAIDSAKPWSCKIGMDDLERVVTEKMREAGLLQIAD